MQGTSLAHAAPRALQRLGMNIAWLLMIAAPVLHATAEVAEVESSQSLHAFSKAMIERDLDAVARGDSAEGLSAIAGWIETDADALAALYGKGAAKGDAAYKGKQILLRGHVARVTGDIIELKRKKRDSTLRIGLGAIEPSFTAQLVPGQTVTLLCHGAGQSKQRPLLEQCTPLAQQRASLIASLLARTEDSLSCTNGSATSTPNKYATHAISFVRMSQAGELSCNGEDISAACLNSALKDKAEAVSQQNFITSLILHDRGCLASRIDETPAEHGWHTPSASEPASGILQGAELSPGDRQMLKFLLEDERLVLMDGGYSAVDDYMGWKPAEAETIAKDYRENEIRGDLAYKDKTVRLLGIVQDIQSDFRNKPAIVLQTDNRLSSVVLGFDGSQLNQIAKLNHGDRIHALCRGAGEVVGTPYLNQCRFAEAEIDTALNGMESAVESYLGGAAEASWSDEQFDMVSAVARIAVTLANANARGEIPCKPPTSFCVKDFVRKNYGDDKPTTLVKIRGVSLALHALGYRALGETAAEHASHGRITRTLSVQPLQ